MKKGRLIKIVFVGSLLAFIYSCSKSGEDFNAQGGLLPSNYITINDNSFTPSTLIVAVGSSITFVNGTNEEHSIVSDDSLTILTGAISAHTSFYYRKDTAGTFPYHCGMHPTARGTIILRP